MEKGTCPECNGSTRVPYNLNPSWKRVIAGYDAATDTLPCSNCGGQYMFGRPTGKVPLNLLGNPCTHVYKGRNAGRCLTEYTCTECGDRYQIDSGD
jgi:hypothetical protein